MKDGAPNWSLFHPCIGRTIAELRLQYPAVRAYGEMVDALWQRGEREAAMRLEDFWNELARLQTFSLLCAYYLWTTSMPRPMAGRCRSARRHCCG